MYAHSIALCASIKRKYCGDNTFSGILESFCNLQTISSVLIHKLRLNLSFSGVVCPGSLHCLRCGWTGVSLSLLWIIALPEAIRHLCSVVYRIMRDCTVAYRHMVGHSCGSSRKVFGDCLDCQGSLSQCARKQYTKVQKSLSPTKCGKRHLKTDSFCAIIAQGIQVSRVPSQMAHICRGTASSNGRQSKGRSRGAYSFVHIYYITSLEILQGLFEEKLNKF